jgi:hypothetical protein
MNRQYVKHTYLGNIAKFASNVVMMSGMNENAALARIVVSDIYQSIKKNNENYSDEALVNAAKEFCNGIGIVVNDNIDVSQPSETLMFKVFCFESYITAKNMSEAEVASVFVQNGIGTYLETVYNVIKTDNHANVVLDIDIYINAREVAHQSEL